MSQCRRQEFTTPLVCLTNTVVSSASCFLEHWRQMNYQKSQSCRMHSSTEEPAWAMRKGVLQEGLYRWTCAIMSHGLCRGTTCKRPTTIGGVELHQLWWVVQQLVGTAFVCIRTARVAGRPCQHKSGTAQFCKYPRGVFLSYSSCFYCLLYPECRAIVVLQLDLRIFLVAGRSVSYRTRQVVPLRSAGESGDEIPI